MWSLFPLRKSLIPPPMGRAMLNICIVTAQPERETIQKRVTDAYYSRSQRGFKMGGIAPYGIHTGPTTFYEDITRYFVKQGILFNGKELIRPMLAQLLRNSVYVQADLDVYEFFKSQGTVIVNDAADYRHERVLSVSRAGCEARQVKRLERPNAGAGSP